METIKVYRVVKDHLAIGYAESISYHPEDLYAYLGYTPFYGRIECGIANNIGYRQTEEGKYFFVFPEDALMCSSMLLYDCCFAAKIVEYEFPLSDVFYNIGYGEYENRIFFHHWVTEFTIGKSRFTGEELSSKSIDEELKRQAISKSYGEVCELLDENIRQKYFRNADFSERIYERFDFRSKDFIDDESQLIRPKEMTGRIWTIINFGCDKNNFKEVNLEHLANNGLVLDSSKDFENFREDVAYLFGCEGSGPDEAKKMIKSYYFNKKM